MSLVAAAIEDTSSVSLLIAAVCALIAAVCALIAVTNVLSCSSVIFSASWLFRIAALEKRKSCYIVLCMFPHTIIHNIAALVNEKRYFKGFSHKVGISCYTYRKNFAFACKNPISPFWEFFIYRGAV